MQKFRLAFTYPSIFYASSPCPAFKWTMIQRTNIFMYNLKYKTEDLDKKKKRYFYWTVFLGNSSYLLKVEGSLH